MKCPDCLGTLFESGAFDVADMFKGKPVVFKNVPAERGRQCGYLLISSAVSGEIEKVLLTGQADEVVVASVFDLARRPIASRKEA